MLSSFKSKKWNVFLPIHLWAFSNGVYYILGKSRHTAFYTIIDAFTKSFETVLQILRKLFSGIFLLFLFLTNLQIINKQRGNLFITLHCWYIEPWNREKSLRLIWQRFSCLLDEWIAKISKNFFFSQWLFEIIHIIHFEIWDLEIWKNFWDMISTI